MGKTILYVAMTLDGYLAGEGDDLSFLQYAKGLPETEHGELEPFEEFFHGVGSLVVGKRTYEWELAHGMGDRHPVPKFVLTDAPADPAKDVTFTSEPVEVVLEQAKSAAGDKNVWIEGGANVAQQFLHAGLVDELVLFVFPIMLGKGIKLFGELDQPLKLELVRSASKQGVNQLNYRVAA